MADGGLPGGGGAFAGLTALVGALGTAAALIIRALLERRRCTKDELAEAIELYELRKAAKKPAKRAAAKRPPRKEQP